MNYIIILSFFIGFVSNVQSQEYKASPPLKDTKKSSFYGGPSWGYQSYSLLVTPINLELHLNDHYTLGAALGHGSWKIQGGFTGKFYHSYPIGVSYNLGITGYIGNVLFNDTLTIDDEQYEVHLSPAATIDLSASNSWRMGSAGRLILTIGYKLPLIKEPYTFRDRFTEIPQDAIETINNLKPGGFFLEIGINWGIGGRIDE